MVYPWSDDALLVLLRDEQPNLLVTDRLAGAANRCRSGQPAHQPLANVADHHHHRLRLRDQSRSASQHGLSPEALDARGVKVRHSPSTALSSVPLNG